MQRREPSQTPPLPYAVSVEARSASSFQTPPIAPSVFAIASPPRKRVGGDAMAKTEGAEAATFC
jgi:hypothetical protein